MKAWKEELWRLLFRTEYDIDSIRSAQALVRANLPGRLYRFRALTPRTLANLEENSEWFSAPENFNDPYDSSLAFVSGFESITCLGSEMPRATLEQALRESDISETESRAVLEAQDPMEEMMTRASKEAGLDLEHLRQIIEDVWALEMGRFRDYATESFTDRNRSGLFVCCLSEIWNSLAMWGHYAASHTGVCLAYDLSGLPRDDPRLLSLFPIRYSHSVFDASPFIEAALQDKAKLNVHFSVLASLVKADDWSYEKEWRIVLPIGGDERGFQGWMPTPSEVLLGCRAEAANPDLTSKLRDLCATKRIQLRRVRLEKGRFALNLAD